MPKGDKLTPKQKKFADKYLETGNASLAAREAYPGTTYATQRQMGSENLTKANIVQYLQSHGMDAANVMVEIMNKQDAKDSDRINAAKDVMDRSIGKASDNKKLEVKSDSLTGMVVIQLDGGNNGS